MNIKFFTFLHVISSLCISCGFNAPMIIGDGNMVTSNMTLEGFKSLKLSCSADVKIHKADERKVIIKTDSNLLQFVNVEIDNGTLKISLADTNVSLNFTSLDIDVYTPAIEKINGEGSDDIVLTDLFESEGFEVVISGSGDVTLQNIAKNMQMTITGSGNIRGKLECENLNAKITGSGDVKIKGKASQTNLNINGSGNFQGENFIIEKAHTNVLDSGNIYIWVTNHLNGKVSGSGDISVKGKPQMEVNISGSGSVKNVE